MRGDEPEVYQIYGSINLASGVDSINIPVFSCYPKNDYFVGVTDNILQIQSFYRLDILFNYLGGMPTQGMTKTQFVTGDTIPLVLSIANHKVVIEGDSIAELISELEELDSQSEAVTDLLRDLNEIYKSTHAYQHREDARWAESRKIDVIPKAARLWLDQAIEKTDESFFRNLDKNAAAREARISLLSWATEIPKVATTPIFNHFLVNARRIESRGIYVQDIIATAIVNWSAEDVARFDRIVDLIRDFRKRYDRAPLSGVLELAEHEVPELSFWARRTLEQYYDSLRGAIENATPYQILAKTFVSDGGRHWPEDILISLRENADRLHIELEKLLTARSRLAASSVGSRIGDYSIKRARESNKRLASLGSQIKYIAGLYDAFRKSIKPSNETTTSQRFSGIDYKALDLNEEFFLTLDREDTDTV